MAGLRDRAPALAVVEDVCCAPGRPDRRRRLRHRAERAGRARGGTGVPGVRGRGHLRGLPGRAVGPGRPAVPLPVRQLHRLRPPLHRGHRHPVRPSTHDDGALRRCARTAPGSTRTPGTGGSTPSRCAARPAARRLVLEPGTTGDPVAEAARLLRGGAVVAVKGLGGYHLACDATDEAAVATLRSRKRREERPFAVLAADLAAASALAHVDPVEAGLLTGRQRPIVLLDRRPGAVLAPSVAPGNRAVGVMLPYTPLHHLLAAAARPAARAHQRQRLRRADRVHRRRRDEPAGAASPTPPSGTTVRSRPGWTTRCSGSSAAGRCRCAGPAATPPSRWRCRGRRRGRCSAAGPSSRRPSACSGTGTRCCRTTSATWRAGRPTGRTPRGSSTTADSSRSPPR